MVKFVMCGALLAGVVALAGCGSGDGEAAASGAAPPSASVSKASRPLTARQVMAALKAAGAPIGKVTVYTAENDPNGKLGRPGQYTSKAASVDRRVPASKVVGAEPGAVDFGCGVEVFPDEASARARSEFIQQAQKSLQGMAGSEYDYLRGGVLLRVTGHLTPRQAAVYQRALNKAAL
ncbi:hypothetical protein [Actinomadura rubrisoli]|uniref:Lipoprotein n=1 Tax=Actinomadura rubrisoli TaxID=2530368 RepID=A0A4R5BQW6_9ACTN|nr:hypothetical protein [Actinomadura rubrisoli]TDD88369.1 hypothetical protein E1298_15275 [Actinomadura rubrisoli]